MNNTNSKLLPCPFCGTTWTALDICVSNIDPVSYACTHYTVECNNCGTVGPEGTSEEEAQEAWNNRRGVK